MKEEKTFYEKVLISSGEVPEKTGWYLTNLGYAKWGNLREYGKIWHWQDGINNDHLNPISNYKITWWLKEVSVPSPKQEAVDKPFIVLYAEIRRRFRSFDDMTEPLRSIMLKCSKIVEQLEKGESK